MRSEVLDDLRKVFDAELDKYRRTYERVGYLTHDQKVEERAFNRALDLIDNQQIKVIEKGNPDVENFADQYEQILKPEVPEGVADFYEEIKDRKLEMILNGFNRTNDERIVDWFNSLRKLNDNSSAKAAKEMYKIVAAIHLHGCRIQPETYVINKEDSSEKEYFVGFDNEMNPLWGEISKARTFSREAKVKPMANYLGGSYIKIDSKENDSEAEGDINANVSINDEIISARVIKTSDMDFESDDDSDFELEEGRNE